MAPFTGGIFPSNFLSTNSCLGRRPLLSDTHPHINMSSPPMPTAPVSPPVAASIWDLANVSDFCSEAPSSSCEVEFSPVEEEGPPSINGSTSSPVPSRVLRNERLIREARMIGQSHRLWSENGVMYLMLPDTSMPVTRQGLLCKVSWRSWGTRMTIVSYRDPYLTSPSPSPRHTHRPSTSGGKSATAWLHCLRMAT